MKNYTFECTSLNVEPFEVNATIFISKPGLKQISLISNITEPKQFQYSFINLSASDDSVLADIRILDHQVLSYHLKKNSLAGKFNILDSIVLLLAPTYQPWTLYSTHRKILTYIIFSVYMKIYQIENMHCALILEESGQFTIIFFFFQNEKGIIIRDLFQEDFSILTNLDPRNFIENFSAMKMRSFDYDQYSLTTTIQLYFSGKHANGFVYNFTFSTDHIIYHTIPISKLQVYSLYDELENEALVIDGIILKLYSNSSNNEKKLVAYHISEPVSYVIGTEVLKDFENPSISIFNYSDHSFVVKDTATSKIALYKVSSQRIVILAQNVETTILSLKVQNDFTEKGVTIHLTVNQDSSSSL